MSLLEKFENNYKFLSQVQQYCLDKILQIDNLNSNSTIQSLADETCVSTTTIFRMIKRLGYNSFNDFKMDLLFNKFNVIDRNNLEENNIQSLDLIETQILKTIELLKSVNIDEIVERLFNSKNVLVCGSGMTNYIGRILEIKLNVNNIHTKHSEDPWFMFLETKNLTSKDTIIILSKTGETKSLIDIAKTAKFNGVKIILISEIGNSTLSDICDYKIYIENVENEGTDIDTRLHIHIAINYLTKEIANKRINSTNS